MSEFIQSDWEESYISEYFELLIGGTPSRNNNAYWDNAKLTGNKWVSIKDIKERYISDTEEKGKLFNALDNFPCIKKKADWAIKWINDKRSSFATRLVAFACVEGLWSASHRQSS
mgnify:CR=1 FL=1